MARHLRRAHLSALVCTVACLLLAGLLAAPSSQADQPGGEYVGVVPVAGTPQIHDGAVLSVVQAGSTMVLAGTFTKASNAGQSQVLSRTGLLAFDATSGALSPTFLPQPNGRVNVVLPSTDGRSVYVGGSFTRIGGVARTGLAQVRLSDGAVVPQFRTGAVKGTVRDLRLAGGRLWVAGRMRDVQGQGPRALVTLDAADGQFLPFMGLRVSGVHNGGSTSVNKIDVTPDGTRLVAIGNFALVGNGRREQLAMLDIGGGQAAPADFGTSFYEAGCGYRFNSYVHDVDFSPDGSYFVVTTTGAYGGATSPCDSTARFETRAGRASRPSWLTLTGGDTNWAVEITDSVVYVGGHFRWQNNNAAADRPGPGAVSRTGLAALDPANGLPLDWDPTRTRGVGVFDFLATEQGLWVASDTDRIGAYYLRPRIALLPAAGTTLPALRRSHLPNAVYLAGLGAPAPAGLTRRTLDDEGRVGADSKISAGGLAEATGAFMLNGEVYSGHTDGSFSRRRFEGSTVGQAAMVDGADQINRLRAWHSDVAAAGGMFFDSGRIYFTRVGSKALYYRYFTPDSGVVGAQRYVASRNVPGIDLAGVRSMMLAGSWLWWTTPNGTLRRISWVDGAQGGAPVGGSAVAVSGPGIDARRWSSSAMFPFQGPSGAGAAVSETVASFTFHCEQLTCTGDAASSSAAPGRRIESYEWAFGDGTTGAGLTVEHGYATSGRVTVTLNVTDDRGATVTARRLVTPAAATVVDHVATRGRGSIGRGHGLRVPGKVASGDRLVLFATANDGGLVRGPGGWKPLAGGRAAGFRSRAWTRVATADDPGARVRLRTGHRVRLDLSLAAYRAAGGTQAAAGVRVTTRSRRSHTTPGVSVAPDGGRVVSYWGQTARGTRTWSAPAGVAVRRQGRSGTGAGAVSALLADAGGAGAAGRLTAGTSAPTRRVASYSVAVTPR